MATPALIQLISLLFLAGLSTAARGRKGSFSRVIKIEEFTECPKARMNTIENVTVSMVGRGKYVMNLVFSVKNTIPGGKLCLTVNKCKTTSASDCEYVMTYHFEYCNMLNSVGPWSSFLEASHPRFKCPMKPANYMIRNASLEASQVMNIGSISPARWWDDYHWRVKFELIDKKQSLGCGIITMSYQRIRSN